VIDYVRTWTDKTELHAKTLVGWIGIPPSKYYQWRERYGQVNDHNAWVPRDHWLEDWEKQAIVDFHHDNPLEGYRRLTYSRKKRTGYFSGSWLVLVGGSTAPARACMLSAKAGTGACASLRR
jgi:hypothetical protein